MFSKVVFVTLPIVELNVSMTAPSPKSEVIVVIPGIVAYPLPRSVNVIWSIPPYAVVDIVE